MREHESIQPCLVILTEIHRNEILGSEDVAHLLTLRESGTMIFTLY